MVNAGWKAALRPHQTNKHQRHKQHKQTTQTTKTTQTTQTRIDHKDIMNQALQAGVHVASIFIIVKAN